MNIANYLRETRIQKELLVRQAAAEMNLDQGLLSKIENGNRVPTESQLSEFSKFYHLDLQKLKIYWNSEKILRILKESSNNAAEILEVVIVRMGSELSSEETVEDMANKTWLDEMMDKY